jgi:anti-sigma regulatory factor (Ser/Thr protein kinase)
MNLDAKLTLSVPASRRAATMARQAVRALQPELCNEFTADLTLLASEVVANGVRHADPRTAENQVTLELFLYSDLVRVEVHDRGDGFVPPPPPSPADDSDSGWGLFLVDRMSKRWGVEESASRVWFELAR